jgi:hypothetical protein
MNWPRRDCQDMAAPCPIGTFEILAIPNGQQTQPAQYGVLAHPVAAKYDEIWEYAKRKGVKIGGYWADGNFLGNAPFRPMTDWETFIALTLTSVVSEINFDIRLMDSYWLTHAAAANLDFMLVDSLDASRREWSRLFSSFGLYFSPAP